MNTNNRPEASKLRPVWLGGKPVALPTNVNKDVLTHASRAIITDHPEDGTVEIRVPRGIARAMFAAAAERAFAESGRFRACQEFEKAEILQRHGAGLAERAHELAENLGTTIHEAEAIYLIASEASELEGETDGTGG